MGEKESHDAAVEARRDSAHRRQAPATHVDAIARYLAGIAYETSRDREEDRDETSRREGQEASAGQAGPGRGWR